MPRTAWAIRCSFSTSAKRTKPSPPGPEPDAGAHGNLRLARELDGELERAKLPVGLRDRSPDEHRPERALDLPADTRQPVTEDVAALAIDLARLARIVALFVQRDDGGDLDRLEGPVVEVGLEPRKRRQRRCVAEREAHTPTGHRERLGERVRLDRDVRGAGNLKDRRRLVPVERDVCVGEVVHDERLVLACQRYEPFHEAEVDHARRRVVGERDDEHTRARTRVCERIREPVVEIVVAPAELDLDHARSCEDGREEVDRVRRRGHDRRVARLNEHPHQMREPFLGADRGDRLRLGIELDAEPVPVEVADRLAQLRDAAAGGVPVVVGLRGCLGQLLDHRRW